MAGWSFCDLRFVVGHTVDEIKAAAFEGVAFCFSRHLAKSPGYVYNKPARIRGSPTAHSLPSPIIQSKGSLDYLFHFSGYFIFSFLAITVLEKFGLSRSLRIWVGVVIIVVFAMIDEGHQYFIPARQAYVGDLACDILGLSWGITSYVLLRWRNY